MIYFILFINAINTVLNEEIINRLNKAQNIKVIDYAIVDSMISTKISIGSSSSRYVPIDLCIDASFISSKFLNVEKMLSSGIDSILYNSITYIMTSYKNSISFHSDNENKINIEEAVHTYERKECEVMFSSLKLNSDGMIPVVVQDYMTNEVLMVAYMNEEAYNKTISTGRMTYYSRSRNELWIKGLTSGHFQYVKELYLDCDKDTLLAKVLQVGNACHTGAYSCFFNKLI